MNDMLRTKLSYIHRWKSKLAEVMAWRIEPPTFNLGVQLWKKVRHPNHSITEDATYIEGNQHLHKCLAPP